MRIIHVEDYFDPKSGYQINELVRAWSFPEDELIILTSNDTTPFHREITKEEDQEFEKLTGAKVIRLKSKLKVSTRLLLDSLWEIIESLEPDVLFLHGIGDFKDFVLLSKKKNYPIFRDCHMSWVASVNIFKHLYYKMYRTVFAPIINTTDKYYKIFALGLEEKQYIEHIGISESKVALLPHGYNGKIMYFDPKERELTRQFYGITSEDIVISYIGKFDVHKRPDLIFEILNFVDKNVFRDFQIKLLFIGSKDNEYMESVFIPKMEAFKYKHGLDVRLDNAKPFQELRKYFSASDIVIYPKQATLSSIHAQVCGCSVIMEKHLSNVERVREKKTYFKSGIWRMSQKTRKHNKK